MTEARNNREFFCIISDGHGNSLKTDNTRMYMSASIKTQPKTQYAALGEKVKFTVEALGSGLKYQWYYKDADGTK